MRLGGRWIHIFSFLSILMLAMGPSVFAEEESRVPEMFEVLKSIEQNLKEENYGTASADLDYLYEIFKEQKGKWLSECFVKEYQKWVRSGEGTQEMVGAAALGGGTTIKQSYTRGTDVVDAKLVVSPVVSGLGALLNNPAFRGGKGKLKRLRNGLKVTVQPNQVSGSDGGILFSWKVIKGEVSPRDLENMAGGTANVGCAKEIVGGQ